MTHDREVERIADDPCPKCDDSGFIETVRGGFWTGESMTTIHTVCDCICGDDVRREHALRTQGARNG
jgi:hypothetical protein